MLNIKGIHIISINLDLYRILYTTANGGNISIHVYIFVKDLDNSYSFGNIPIFNRQEQALHEKFRNNTKKITNLIKSLY